MTFRIKRLLLGLTTLLGLLMASPAVAQTITPEELWQQVVNNHPIAQQALLLQQQAEQDVRMARAPFDPKFYADHQAKQFGGKDYYNIGEGGVKWQTRWGIDLKAAYDWTQPDGLYLNPERTIPAGGQVLLGVEIPILQGLLFDQDRNALQQAFAGKALSLALADGLRNELYLQTWKTYWDWSYAWHARALAAEARNYSLERLNGIRSGHFAGDYPAIDTLEAFLQWQSWDVEVQEAQLQLIHTEAALQNLWWNDQGQPIAWNPNWQPVHPDLLLEQPALDTLQSLLTGHPALVAYQRQLDQLQLERRWKAEQYKPELTFQYNLLGNQFDLNPDDAPGWQNLLTDNFKWGFTFSQPLFLRKARAGVALTDIKIAQTNWKLAEKQQNLQTKLNAYWQSWQTRSQQLNTVSDMVANYQSLLEAEQVKFNLGESSVFLLNSRQQKLLQAQLKFLKAQAELQKNAGALWYAAGRSR
ncbi:MAG: TolC family protein [Saprospiraceae bacterium]